MSTSVLQAAQISLYRLLVGWPRVTLILGLTHSCTCLPGQRTCANALLKRSMSSRPGEPYASSSLSNRISMVLLGTMTLQEQVRQAATMT